MKRLPMPEVAPGLFEITCPRCRVVRVVKRDYRTRLICHGKSGKCVRCARLGGEESLAPPCRHCKLFPGPRPRGLCDTCYRGCARGLYARGSLNPATAKFCPSYETTGNQPDMEIPPGLDASTLFPELPTTFRPGTAEKLYLMFLRVKLRLPIHRPGDATNRGRCVDPRFELGGGGVIVSEETEDDTEEAA
jgi:hypothetical protein